MSELNRIRWKCRRGTLELDLLLTGFVDRHYSSLNPTERDEFSALLELDDEELWALLTEEVEVPDAGGVLERLRGC